MANETELRAALEPCPFCDSDNIRLNRPANGERPFVMCNNCFSAGPQADEATAIAGWNRRATPAPDQGAEERAREVLEKHYEAAGDKLMAEFCRNINDPDTRVCVEAMLSFAAAERATLREAEAVRAEAWQSIETAPKDGGFLVWSPDHPEWAMPVKAEMYHGAMERHAKGMQPAHLGFAHFTHWMPLPAPPATAIRSAEGC